MLKTLHGYLSRELAKVTRAPGVGLGWRLTVKGKRYPVREPEQPIDEERLLAESDAAAERIQAREEGA